MAMVRQETTIPLGLVLPTIEGQIRRPGIPQIPVRVKGYPATAAFRTLANLSTLPDGRDTPIRATTGRPAVSATARSSSACRGSASPGGSCRKPFASTGRPRPRNRDKGRRGVEASADFHTWVRTVAAA